MKNIVVVNGKVDRAASHAKLDEAIEAYEQKYTLGDDVLAARVDAVFDAAGEGERVTLPAIQAAVVSALGVTENLMSVRDQVKGYINTHKRFNVRQGPGNGVLRLAREGEPVPEVPAKKTARKKNDVES